MISEALDIKFRRVSDSTFPLFLPPGEVAANCAVIQDWSIVQIHCGASDLHQSIFYGKTLRGSIEPTAGGV